MNADLAARIALLELQNEKMRRALYGQRSERGELLVDQLELGLEELEASASEDEALGQRAAIGTNVEAFTRARPSRKPLPDHLPRERVVVPAPASCPCCGSDRLSKLGEDVTETLEVWTYVRDDRPFGGPTPPAALFRYSRDRRTGSTNCCRGTGNHPPPCSGQHSNGLHRRLTLDSQWDYAQSDDVPTEASPSLLFSSGCLAVLTHAVPSFVRSATTSHNSLWVAQSWLPPPRTVCRRPTSVEIYPIAGRAPTCPRD